MKASPAPAVWFPAIRAGSGADVFTRTLAAGLQERGIRVQIGWLAHRAEYAPWTVATPQPPAWANVVHVNTWLPAGFIPRDLPTVATVHHCVQDPLLSPYKSPAQRLYHRFRVTPNERRVLERARRTVAVSRYTAAQTQRVFGFVHPEVVLNGIDTQVFAPGPRRSAPHAPFRLLFVGSLSQRKGADLLAPILEALGPGYELWVVAGRRARAIRLPSGCRLIPPQPTAQALAAVYRDCDALLFPTRLEGFGLACVEAQSCGLPVIGSRCSALPETVADGRSGLLCPVDDVTAFASAVAALRDDPGRWAEMRCEARRFVQERFSLAAMVSGYLRIYESVLADTAS